MVLVDKTAVQHALADEELVGRVDDRVGAVFADREHAVVERDVEEHVAVDLVPEVAALVVVAHLEVAVGRVAHVDLVERDDLGAARELVAVFIKQPLDKIDGVGDDDGQVVSDLAQATADIGHLFFGAVDIVKRNAADRDLE